MNSIILNTASNFGNVVDHDDIAKINNTPLWSYEQDNWMHTQNDYYFFFDSELNIPSTSDRKIYLQLKETQLRHCIPYKGKFFDYIVKKEYATLEEWAADNRKTTHDICYGRADIHFRTTDPAHTEWWRKKQFIHYIRLFQLVKFLMPSDNTTQIVYEDDMSYIQEVNIPSNDKLDEILRQIDAIRASVEELRTV
jgi:hypothetical protein